MSEQDMKRMIEFDNAADKAENFSLIAKKRKLILWI